MKRFTIFMLGMMGALIASAQCVYFSEYIEGSGNNKCLEIYNGTGDSLDLNALGYTVYIYANGSNSNTSTIQLAGNLPPGEVFVACNPNADSVLLAQADQTSGNINFNGDDAVEIVNQNGSLDVIGEIGFDPGAEWTGASCTGGTANSTLIRRPDLACPSFDGLSAFNPDGEWNCLANNTFSDLGSHTMTACLITDLQVVIDSCSSGMASVLLDFHQVNSASNAFELTISPDPGGYSGIYPYATSLPLKINGIMADSLTNYSFSIADTADNSCSAQLLNQVFDCPIADQVTFSIVPFGCVGVNNSFLLEVCAVEGSNGKIQPDFNGAISLTLDPGAIGNVSGDLTEMAIDGCATFSLSYDATDTISFTASDGSLLNANSGDIRITSNCASLTIHKAILNPCGDDSKNEYFGGNTGNAPVSVGDLMIANINPNSGAQPNTNFTWSASGNDNGGNPAESCGVIGLQCNRLLDINDPIDSVLITDLIDSLNIQAGCSLFIAPTGSNLGTIPAYSKVIFFFGGGGNTSGTILPGFDGLGTNLDFSIFCGQGPVYAVFGNHKNASTTFGFYSNSAPRTYCISVNGNISTNLTYSTPSGSGESETVKGNGVYSWGEDCTPMDLFADISLGAELLWFDGRMERGKGIELEWEMFQDFQDHSITIERANKDTHFQPISVMNSTTKKGEIQRFNYTDFQPFSGFNSYRLKFENLNGEETYSEVIDIEYVIEGSVNLISLYPNPGSQAITLAIHAKEASDVRFQLISILGKSTLVRNLNLSEERIHLT